MILKFGKCRIMCREMHLYSPIRAIKGCKNSIQKQFCLTNDDQKKNLHLSKKFIIERFLPNEFSSSTFSLSSKNSKYWARRTEISEKNFISVLTSSLESTICASLNPLPLLRLSLLSCLFHTFATGLLVSESIRKSLCQ